MRGRRRLVVAARSEHPPDLGMRASQMDAGLTVGSIADLTVDSTEGLAEDLDLIVDSDLVVDSDVAVLVLVLVGAGDGVGAGTRGGGEAGDRRGGDGAILATHTGE